MNASPSFFRMSSKNFTSVKSSSIHALLILSESVATLSVCRGGLDTSLLLCACCSLPNGDVESVMVWSADGVPTLPTLPSHIETTDTYVEAGSISMKGMHTGEEMRKYQLTFFPTSLKPERPGCSLLFFALTNLGSPPRMNLLLSMRSFSR